MSIEETYLEHDINEKYDSILRGMIIMWSGAVTDIPDGWALCDGNNGTPDLRDRFVVGAGNSYSVGDTGGANSVTLTVNQLPAHTHTTVAHNHIWNAYWTGKQLGRYHYSGTSAHGYYNDIDTTYATTAASSPTTNSTGGGSAHENRPPYYALCYIMKIA